MRKIIFISCSLLLLIACNSPKSLTKKGNKLQTQELHQQAADYYCQALAKKADYIDAQIGLKTSGQRVVNKHLDDFFKSKNFGNKKAAVYHYLAATKYKEKVSQFNIELNIASHQTSDYKEILQEYISETYDIALNLLTQEAFKEAEKHFIEIDKLMPGYKDVSELKNTATYEPLYRSGTELLQAEHFRASYYQFEKIPSSYKDTKELQALSLEAGIFTLSLMKFDNTTNKKGGASKVAAYLTERLMKLENPFIKLVDRKHTETIINEQLMGLSGQTTEGTAATAGNMTGVKAIVTGKLLTFSKEVSPLKKESKKAWRERSIKKLNEETGKHYYEKVYDKIRYKEYQASNKVNLSFQFQLISTESGAVLLTDIINVTKSSSIHYAQADHHYKDIVPGSWKHMNSAHTSDEVSTSYSRKRQLHRLFGANKKLESVEQLSNQAYKHAAAKASRKIDLFNPEK